ncbi:hypothetical protein ABT336_11885 [Micromonospora sp. NPDC000207]|uniref:hypothetical protein n=1 Tax=Micromonospora sp. NPDC000207 TaxID=3154246 RepID=UPI00332A61BE
MTTDTRTTAITRAATPAPTEIQSPVKVKKHYNWRHVATEAAALTAACTATAGVSGLVFDVLPTASNALLVATAVLVGLLVWLLVETIREGRKWVRTDPGEPYYGDPPPIP